MPTEMAIPFSLSPDGTVEMVSDTYDRALQRVKGLVSTRPTERPMDAAFGVPVDTLVFEPDDDDMVAMELRDMVTSALATYEPGIEVTSVQAIRDDTGDGIASVEVLFHLSEDPIAGTNQFVNTATIKPGGVVKEVIRG